ncbi:universal stress protein [Cellulomonas rhizosphaerae]|nr:universal stress protein [Cellulomonas rhizosphaerae]
MSTARSRAWSGAVPDEVVVVGVHPEQDVRVLAAAAGLATRVGAGLVCVWVDPTRRTVRRDDDGTLEMTPLDPDDEDAEQDAEADEISNRIGRRLAGSGPAWRFVVAAGEIASELAAVSERYPTSYVVVGSRRPGLTGWMNEAIGGSVAGRLAHTQPHPVVVVPLAPTR